jgi:uncharacterized protein YjiS (DUF1127 family)
MAYSNTTSAPTFSLLARIGSGFDAMVNSYKKYRLYRETHDGLSALTNRELADLGVHRCDITRIAREATRG